MRVLIVEDDPRMGRLLQQGMSAEGISVHLEAEGEDGVASAVDGEFDVIVLDVMLPDIDGFEVCRRLREARVWTPVLMLTARKEVEDRIAALDGGADDYLSKPFAFGELLARLRALARRGATTRPNVLTVGDLRLDPAAHEAWRGAT